MPRPRTLPPTPTSKLALYSGSIGDAASSPACDRFPVVKRQVSWCRVVKAA